MLLRYIKTYKKDNTWCVVDTDIPLLKESANIEALLSYKDGFLYVPAEYIYNMFGDYYFKLSSMFDYIGLPTSHILTNTFATKKDVVVEHIDNTNTDIYNLSVSTDIHKLSPSDLEQAINYNLNDVINVLNLVDDLNSVVTYTFELSRKSGNKGVSGGNQMISSNDRLHPIVKSQITSYLRGLAEKTILENPHNQQFSPENPCSVKVYVSAPTKRRMDPANWYPTVKALLDGMTDAGLWSDDDYKVIREVSFVYDGLSGSKNYKIKLEITKDNR